MRAVPLGDSALLLELGHEIDLALNRRIHRLAASLMHAPPEGIREVTPTYAALLVHYDPLILDFSTVQAWVSQQAEESREAAEAPSRLVEVPVHYGGEYGPDLAFVAEHNHLSAAEVIRIHCAPEYTVFMMGFTPGFPYLGGMSAAIAAPRLPTPRTVIPAGSVGIAGLQTGIYPQASPGGWRLIGRTNLPLFQPASQQPFLLAPGDRIKFHVANS